MTHNNKGKFITLDGIDGAGKTTQLNVIRDWFAQQGLPVVFTREPGGTILGEQLRALLLNQQSKISLHTETLLMFAARRQHIEEVILPTLAAGTHIVSDRFTDATYAYQGGGRGLAYEKIELLEDWVQEGLYPDLTILLDVPLEVSLARIENSREKDRFEQENAHFFQRVRDAYLTRQQSAPQRYVLINSDREKNNVKQDIENILYQLFTLN